MKVFIVGGGSQYADMFRARGWEVMDWTNPTNILDCDLVQFTGGEDVTPELYNQRNTRSHFNLNRDIKEAGVFAVALRIHKPMAGICRGGQFLNVMCGGEMIQHVDGHATGKTHKIARVGWLGKKYDEIEVTSTHHQMMIPGEEASILAVAGITSDCDYEVLFYEESKVLCFQPHPEFGGYEECTNYYFELLKDYLG